MKNYIRTDLQHVTPYSSARDEFEGVGEVFLDANENGLATDYNRYPDPLQSQLKEVISSIKGVGKQHIFLGNGSDEVLDLILRLTCTSFTDSIAFLNPSYGMYGVLAKINGLKTIVIPLDSQFQIETDELIYQAKGAKVLLLCNPNNPTGNAMQKEKILEIVAGFDGVVVVDEAYSDFCPQVSAQDEVDNFPNLIVVQTLSKAYGMAGLRVGMAIANTNWISALNSIKPPYNISSLVQEKAIYYLENTDWKTITATILSERKRVFDFLSTNPLVEKVFPSDSNFILFRTPDADKVYTFLVNKGIIVRNRSSQFGCHDCLRVSIGTVEENSRFMDAFNSYI